MPSVSRIAPNQPFGAKSVGERDAGDGGRQREGQVDERVEQAAAGKAVAHQHPGKRRPKTTLKTVAASAAEHGDAVARRARAATETMRQ